jgi:sulfur transfer complex TusBCD TusB component (DsrH family)
MNKKLLFWAIAFLGIANVAIAQTIVSNNDSTLSLACDLNLPGIVPSFNAQCAVEFSDLVIPEITDSCGNTVVPTTDTGIFPVTATGTTTIFWEYLNELGNIETQIQNINILDFIQPVPDVAILPNFYSQCAVLQTDLPVPTATDNCSPIVTVTNDAVFPITVSTLITWFYTDATGNTRFQPQDIYINDFTEPVADVAILPNIHGLCSVQEADVPVPTATDNCLGIVTVTNDAVFPITRSTLITWFYTDAHGNTSYQTQDIYIDDLTTPIPDNATLADVSALCEILEADVLVPTATDNCSGVIAATSNVVFPITTSTVITWTYTDANGNIETQTQNAFITDAVEPVPDVAVLADFNSQCALLAIDVPVPTATDNCSGVIAATSNAVFPITASTTITWTYADTNGNSETQTQNIVINDTTAPLPDAIVLADITAQCELFEADVIAPTATDNCSGIVTVTNDGIFPITASTTITWTYGDATGNSETQTQNIVINDTTSPTPDAIVLADITAQCEVLEVDVIAPTATDNCSGIVTVTNDGIFPITASTTITWTYVDANGNSEAQTQNIVINDTTAPLPDAIVLADITAQCEVLEADIIAPTATDNCSGIVTVTNDGVFPITTSTTITWTYADANGNSETQTQNIVINDTTAPLPDAIVLADITAQCEVLEIDVIAPTATDNCSGIVTVTNDAVFPITTQGVTTITWTYTDVNGNTSTQTQDILIGDNTSPTVTLTDITVSVNVSGIVNINAAQLENGTANDNCGIASITVTPNTFTCAALGDHVVIVTVIDIHGNSISDTATVTVTDPTDFCGALGVVQNEKATIALYPNPTADSIYMESGNQTIIHSVSLYSLSGQLILQESYKQPSEKNSMSLAFLAQGTYLMKLETNEGTYTKRVIKQ